jgi:Rrf2 family iron-sulfur cluster assembly transcriptional regulator
MQISSSNYMGVETLVRLAVQNANKPCTTQGLAEWINRSVSYTESLMAQLINAGLVVARHGPGGGYTLARPAHRITVAEVFRAFDEPRGLPARPLNAVTLEPETIQNIHGTDLLWELLKSHILLFLDQISLADIAQQSTGELASDEAEPVAMEPHMQSTSMH